ncbi:peptide deformylase [Spirochaetia bacterium]|nr:peptide deformylase [Spirochaetia bacterium]
MGNHTDMEVIILGDDLLRQKAEPVKPINAATAKLAEEMIETMHQSKGVGLAAPQVGIMKRLFVIHVDDDIPRVFINPSIVATSQETVKQEEGCLSIPRVWAEVIRPESVRVQAWNEKGRPFTIETGGMLARVILHEYDHLEGTLFIDRLPELKRQKVIAKFEKKQQA